MDTREYLVEAQKVEALADAAEKPIDAQRWEEIGREFRRLAKVVAFMPAPQQRSVD